MPFLSQPYSDAFSTWEEKFISASPHLHPGVDSNAQLQSGPGGLTHGDLIGVVGVGEGQVDHVILPERVVQARLCILPSSQHQSHSLLVSHRGGHVRLLRQLPVGRVLIRMSSQSLSWLMHINLKTPVRSSQFLLTKQKVFSQIIYDNGLSATHLRFSSILRLSTSFMKFSIKPSSTSFFSSFTQRGIDSSFLMAKWPMRMPTVKKIRPHTAEINKVFNIVVLGARPSDEMSTLSLALTDCELSFKDLWCYSNQKTSSLYSC